MYIHCLNLNFGGEVSYTFILVTNNVYEKKFIGLFWVKTLVHILTYNRHFSSKNLYELFHKWEFLGNWTIYYSTIVICEFDVMCSYAKNDTTHSKEYDK